MAKFYDALSVVQIINKAWEAHDIDGLMNFIGEHCVLNVHLPEGLAAHCGGSIGRDAVRAALTEFRRQYDFILYRPIVVSFSQREVRQRVEFMATQTSSGARVVLNCRQVWVVENGLVVTCDEYHDAPLVEAQIRMIEWAEKDSRPK
jgi:hypothetical protein